MTGHAQVIEFAGFWPLERDFLANRFEEFPRIASRDSSRSSRWSGGILRCDHASDGSGLDIARVEVDPKTSKIVVVMKGEPEEKIEANPFDQAPLPELERQKRKTKSSCKSN